MELLGWIILVGVGVLALVGAIVLPARLGRGALGGGPKNPLNEIQDATPRRGWWP